MLCDAMCVRRSGSLRLRSLGVSQPMKSRLFFASRARRRATGILAASTSTSSFRPPLGITPLASTPKLFGGRTRPDTTPVACPNTRTSSRSLAAGRVCQIWAEPFFCCRGRSSARLPRRTPIAPSNFSPFPQPRCLSVADCASAHLETARSCCFWLPLLT